MAITNINDPNFFKDENIEELGRPATEGEVQVVHKNGETYIGGANGPMENSDLPDSVIGPGQPVTPPEAQSSGREPESEGDLPEVEDASVDPDGDDDVDDDELDPEDLEPGDDEVVEAPDDDEIPLGDEDDPYQKRFDDLRAWANQLKEENDRLKSAPPEPAAEAPVARQQIIDHVQVNPVEAFEYALAYDPDAVPDVIGEVVADSNSLAAEASHLSAAARDAAAEGDAIEAQRLSVEAERLHQISRDAAATAEQMRHRSFAVAQERATAPVQEAQRMQTIASTAAKLLENPEYKQYAGRLGELVGPHIAAGQIQTADDALRAYQHALLVAKGEDAENIARKATEAARKRYARRKARAAAGESSPGAPRATTTPADEGESTWNAVVAKQKYDPAKAFMRLGE